MHCSHITLTYFLMRRAVTIFVIPWYHIKASRSPKGGLTDLTEKKRKRDTETQRKEKRQICGRYDLQPGSIFTLFLIQKLLQFIDTI